MKESDCCVVFSLPVQISVSKLKGEALGVMLIDSGYGSAIPACVVAYISKLGAVHKSGLLNVGDQLLSV